MIVGHERQVAYLQKVIKKSTWAHGYLFCGPEHVGKTATAFQFARSLICDKSLAEWGGCQKCVQCGLEDLRLSDRFFELVPRSREEAEKNDTTREISIKEISALRRWLMFRSAKSRVIIVQRAEVMSKDAANALLKILEEPNPGTVFIFITSTPQYILPTVRSRTVPLRFDFVPDRELRKIKGATDELIQLAAGRPGVLISSVNDIEFYANEKDLLGMALKVWNGGVSEATMVSKKLAEAEAQWNAIFLHLARLIKREMIFAKTDSIPRLVLSVTSGLKVISNFETTNVNRRLALDVIFFNLQRARS